MAKAKKAAATAAKAAKLAFTIAEAAKEAGLSEAHLRLKLRNAKVKKTGKSYGWESKAAMLKDVGSVTKAA